MGTVFVNGKFTAQRVTGVQRVAASLVEAIDRRLAHQPSDGRRWVLLQPPAGRPPALRHIETRVVGTPGQPLHLWEQWSLPRAARGGLLLNLAGGAPALAGPQACMLHDAAVFDAGAAYTLPFRLWYRALFRRLGRRARLLLTISEFSRGRLAAALGVPNERLRVLPLGADHLDGVAADPRVLERHGLRGARFLLAVGSANPNKNLAALLAAWRALAPAAQLVLCGGSDRRVFADAAGADDPPGVLRLGAVDDAELKALYGAAQGLVIPSLYEGWGLPPLEAMACGCPVAASDAAALPEACGDAALLFDARDPQAIAQALGRLLDDAPLREALRTRGQRRAAALRWDDAAARLVALLTEKGQPA